MELIIDDRVIVTPIMTILTTLKNELNNGYLREIRYKGDYVSITCPFHNNGQEKHPSCSVYGRRDNNKIMYGVTHCFRAGTMIPTKEGIKPIETLLDKPTYIINGNGEWEETQFKYYGTDKLYKVNLVRENIHNTIYTTAEHQWFVKRESELKRTVDLKCGDYLNSKYHYAEDFNIIEEAVRHGIVYADGYKCNCYHKKRIEGSNTKRYIDKTIPIDKHTFSINFSLNSKSNKVNLIRFFNDDNWSIAKKPYKDLIFVQSKRLPLELNYKKLPDLSMGRDYIMSFLAGYFACDGSIKGRSFSTVNYEDMLKLRDLFVACGISIRNLTVTKREPGKTYLKDRESVLYTTRVLLETLPERFFINEQPNLKNKKYIRGRWKVESVEETDLIEPVYCCETSTESFVIDENILTHNCFCCGMKTTLYDLIGYCFGKDANYGALWLKERFGTVKLVEDIDLPLIEISNKKEKNILNENVLNDFSSYHPYLQKRHISQETAERFKVKYNKEKETIVFPVWDEYNNLVMSTERSVKTKQFYIPLGVDKPVYLLNYVFKDNIKDVCVCESQFNTLTCWEWGYPAIGLFGTGSNKQYEILKRSNIIHYTLCFDGDGAGRHGAERFIQALGNKALISIKQIPEGKDVNDLTKEEFDALPIIE